MCGAEKSKRPVLGEVYDVRIPQDFGPRSLAKHMQGATSVRCPERLPACFGMHLVDRHGVRRPERLPVCFGMRLVDGHDVRPLELGPRCLAKRCAGSDLCSSANSAGPTGRKAYDMRRLKVRKTCSRGSL